MPRSTSPSGEAAPRAGALSESSRARSWRTLSRCACGASARTAARRVLGSRAPRGAVLLQRGEQRAHRLLGADRPEPLDAAEPRRRVARREQPLADGHAEAAAQGASRRPRPPRTPCRLPPRPAAPGRSARPAEALLGPPSRWPRALRRGPGRGGFQGGPRIRCTALSRDPTARCRPRLRPCQRRVTAWKFDGSTRYVDRTVQPRNARCKRGDA